MNNQVHILLVDHYAMVRSGLRALLDGEPDLVVVGEAGNAETAVTLTDSLHPDLIILDPRLSDFDGLDLIKAVRLHRPETHILVLSNYPDRQRVVAALAAGAQGYWLKDNNSSRIISAIHLVMAGQRVLHPLLAQP